jgi:hypothetical protein
MPFPGDIPDTLPCALSEDFYQEKLPSQPLVERFRGKFTSIGMYPGKKSGYTVVRPLAIVTADSSDN